jgi:hypothetical protein
MLLIFGECNMNGTIAARVFRQRYPQTIPPPSRRYFRRLVDRVERTGNVQPFHRVPNQGNHHGNIRDADILAFFDINPTSSIRHCSMESGLSTKAIWNVLSRHEMHPFHYTRQQNLYQGDSERRLDFCNFFLEEVDLNGENFASSIIWSDESKFTRDGVFNRHNSHFWSAVNPHLIREDRNQQQFNVNVWCGIVGEEIVGPVFYDGNLNGLRYLDEILENTLEPFLDNLPLTRLRLLWFQQDGAPPHQILLVRHWLNQHFNNQWIGTAGPVRWPPRSPDLTPLDFFLWGHVKDYVYRTPVNNKPDLLRRIRTAFQTITPDMLVRAQNDVIYRARMCVGENGNHFEHIL